MRIAIKGLSEAERLELARLYIKAGYTVRLGRERPAGKPSGQYIPFVELLGAEKAAPGGKDTKAGGMGDNSEIKITQEGGGVSAGTP